MRDTCHSALTAVTRNIPICIVLPQERTGAQSGYVIATIGIGRVIIQQLTKHSSCFRLPQY